jgi:hypothetical protein
MRASQDIAELKNTCLYIILRSLEKWWVDCEGREHGPFTTQEAAGRSALEIARIFGDIERPWEVLSKGEDGFYRVIGSSLQDRR